MSVALACPNKTSHTFHQSGPSSYLVVSTGVRGFQTRLPREGQENHRTAGGVTTGKSPGYTKHQVVWLLSTTLYQQNTPLSIPDPQTGEYGIVCTVKAQAYPVCPARGESCQHPQLQKPARHGCSLLSACDDCRAFWHFWEGNP